jgi:hypothetical protein
MYCLGIKQSMQREKSTCLAYRKLEILPRNRSGFLTTQTNNRKQTPINNIQHSPYAKLKESLTKRAFAFQKHYTQRLELKRYSFQNV